MDPTPHTRLFAVVDTDCGASSLLIFFGLRNFRRTKVSKKEEKVMSVERSSGNFSFIYVLMIVVFVRSLYTMGISTFLPYYLDIVKEQ